MDCVTVGSACNGGLVDNGWLSSRRVPRARRQVAVYTAAQGTCKASSYIVGIAQASVAGYRDVSIDSEHVFNVASGTATCAHRP